MNVTLEQIILKGVLQYLGRVFAPAALDGTTEGNQSLDPVFVSTTDKYQVMNAIKNQTGTFKYPYLFLRLLRVAAPQLNTAYNLKTAARLGRMGGVNDSKNSYTNHKIIPVDLECEITFIVDDFWKSMAFANAWMFAVAQKSLNFQVTFDGIEIGIQVQLEDSLNTPDKDNSVDVSNAYEYVGNLTIRGYMSENKAYVDLQKYPMFNRVVVSPIVVASNKTIDEQIAEQQAEGTPPPYVEIPPESPNSLTRYEQVTLEIKSLDQASDEE